MLLFIVFSCICIITCIDFKTSHVIVYQTKIIRVFSDNPISKHLMLLFIANSTHNAKFIVSISKHLMLLFIAQIILHCICHFLISKHLMLLFITNNQITVKLGDKFQNISCYCLSIAVLSKVWYSKYFKTSHVIVYPWHFRVF